MATRLPLHDAHARLGARFVDVASTLVPLHYGDPGSEHEAVRRGVGVIDRSERGKVEATGRDRVSFLQGMLSNDVKALAPGRGCPAAFLDAHGKVLSLLTLHCLADGLVLEMERTLVEPTLSALDRFLISERVEFEDASGTSGILTLAGPAARATVEKVLGKAVPDLPLLHHALAEQDGVAVRLVRTGESGEEGYDLWATPEALPRLWERALAAGARPVGRESWNILRVEAGVVWHGADVDASTLVMEAPLEHAYSIAKGCYIGQEVIARVTYRGHVNRKLVGFLFPDNRIPAPGAAVRVGEKEVGRITSPVVSPTLGRGVALGFLRREHWQPGTPVEVVTGDGPLMAEVADLPFYRRS